MRGVLELRGRRFIVRFSDSRFKLGEFVRVLGLRDGQLVANALSQWINLLNDFYADIILVFLHIVFVENQQLYVALSALWLVPGAVDIACSTRLNKLVLGIKLARGSRLTFSSVVVYTGNSHDAAVIIIACDCRHCHDVLWLFSTLVRGYYLSITSIIDILEVA